MNYYAKLTHEGKAIALPVNDDGTLDCIYKNLNGHLETNATEVDCSRNQLTSLNCPNATHVYCWNNKLTSLNCPNATWVRCWDNQLTSLDCPNIEILYSDVLMLNGKLSIGEDGIISTIVSTKTSGDYTIHLDDRGFYIAMKGKWSAHAETAKEAISECVFKEENESLDKSEIIDRIKSKGTVNWLDYRLLTGACRAMTLKFLEERELPEDVEVSISEAINLTAGRYGSEQFKAMLS